MVTVISVTLKSLGGGYFYLWKWILLQKIKIYIPKNIDPFVCINKVF